MSSDVLCFKMVIDVINVTQHSSEIWSRKTRKNIPIERKILDIFT